MEENWYGSDRVFDRINKYSLNSGYLIECKWFWFWIFSSVHFGSVWISLLLTIHIFKKKKNWRRTPNQKKRETKHWPIAWNLSSPNFSAIATCKLQMSKNEIYVVIIIWILRTRNPWTVNLWCKSEIYSKPATVKKNRRAGSKWCSNSQ